METTTRKTHMDNVRRTWGTPGSYVATVWGADALWDLSADGKSILIHLDRPDLDVRKRRLADHAAKVAELAAADCPMCREMAIVGGDEVFDERGSAVEPGSGRDLDLRAGPRRETEPGGGIAGPGCSAPLPPVVRGRPEPEPVARNTPDAMDSLALAMGLKLPEYPAGIPAPVAAPSPAKIPADRWLSMATIRAIKAVGQRAVGAVMSACGKKSADWSRSGVEQAAQWLTDGDRRAGVARPWPMLAARLRKALELTPRFAPGAMLDAAALPRGDAKAVRP